MLTCAIIVSDISDLVDELVKYCGCASLNTAAVRCYQMNKKTEAIEDCTKAIELDDKYIKAYLRRAKWYVTEPLF